MTIAAVSLAQQHQVHFCDALMIVAAQDAQCETLLTEDLSHGQRFGGVTVADPFRVSPPEPAAGV